MSTPAPTPLNYFAALQDILRLQTEVLTRVLPHSGERGSNDEEHFKAFLRRILPHQYSIGTGFVISSNATVPPSAQTDIIIFDEFYNSPLFRELAASVYPIEIVYAAIEVKRVLQSKDIAPCLDAIARIRRLAKEKRYVKFGSAKMSRDEKPHVILEEFSNTLAPRTFIVAYDTQFRSAESLQDALTEALDENKDAHVHGCLVLSKNWYFSQIAYVEPTSFVNEEKHGLVHFLTGLLTAASSMNMAIANMNPYFDIGYIYSPLDTDPHHES
jgi:hypothetical protein